MISSFASDLVEAAQCCGSVDGLDCQGLQHQTVDCIAAAGSEGCGDDVELM